MEPRHAARNVLQSLLVVRVAIPGYFSLSPCWWSGWLSLAISPSVLAGGQGGYPWLFLPQYVGGQGGYPWLFLPQSLLVVRVAIPGYFSLSMLVVRVAIPGYFSLSPCW